MSAPGEFAIIERYFKRPVADPACIAGIGDDAAIIDVAGRLAVAVDTLVAGIHFPLDFDARSIGHRALAVNLSDLAAVGARARWATLALTLPASDPGWLDAFAAGFFALAERAGVALIGGDTTRGPLTITVQVLGDISTQPLLRSGGAPGDAVFVTGTLGDSAAALEVLDRPVAEQSADVAAVIERFSFPEPRLDFGAGLAEIGAAAIDVSDGLLADLGHLCEQSACGAEIDPALLPLSPALRRLHPADAATRFALRGGDDYELCFAVAPDRVAFVHELAAATATTVTAIGHLVAGDGVRVVGVDRADTAAGFTHF